MEIKTSELSGAALDWAVAQAAGMKPHIGYGEAIQARPRTCVTRGFGMGQTMPIEIDFRPSFDWSQGGPLIHSQEITIDPARSGDLWAASNIDEHWSVGPHPLIAACRAIVLAKLGDTVTVPDELEG